MNRPLNDLEKVFWLLDRAASQNFVMVAHLSDPIDESVLKKALDLLQEKHPPLKCRFKDGDVQMYVGGAPKIPLKLIEKKGDQHWIEIAEKEMVEFFNWTEGPLVRTVMLTSKTGCDILITFCHIIADALSGVKFVQSLLQIIDQIIKGEPIDRVLPLPTLSAALELLKKDLQYPPEPTHHGEIDHNNAVNLKCEQVVPLEDRVTRVIHKTISKEDTKSLLEECRKEKTSIHGALCAALMQATVEQIKKEQDIKQKGPLLIGCTTPVSIRHLFSQPVDEQIGNFISDGIHFQSIDNNSSLWEAARQVKEALQNELKYGRDIKAVQNIGSLLDNFSTPKETLNTLEGALPPILVTNLGQLNISGSFENFKLTALHFTASFNPAAKVGLAVSSFNGVMTINFQYLSPYVSEKTMSFIVENTLKRLNASISNS